ncbi:MAG TPA: RNA-binding S4 domain-containing protein [Clostridia bacterium]|nr:RNA-binding S4 domain-containing protein [Clostridia bacterium]
MRLDKFLAASRLIKRRTLAKEACECGRVTVNGRQAKPASDVNVGDTIEVDFQTQKVKVRVTWLPEERPGATDGIRMPAGRRPSKALARLMYERIQE